VINPNIDPTAAADSSPEAPKASPGAPTSSPIDEPRPTPEAATQSLKEHLYDLRANHFQARSRVSPQHVPRASGIEKCARKVQNGIRHWEKRPLFDDYVGARLERGSQVEELIITPALMQMGLKVSQGQRACSVKNAAGDTICTGHIDGRIAWQGYDVVFEVKTMHPNLFARMKTVEDMLRNQWAFRYPNQLLTYMTAYEEPCGMFIIDDCLGHQRYIPICLDDYRSVVADWLSTCDDVVKANKAGEDLPYHADPTECRSCWCFEAGVCTPPLDFGESGIQLLASDTLIEALEEMEDTQEAHRAYGRAERVLSKHLKEEPDGIKVVGPFRVETETKDRAGYTVADGTTMRKKWERYIPKTVPDEEAPNDGTDVEAVA
jgi:hypothetical protein